MSREPYVPGATTIGMVCKDGVLLASERRYAYGSFVMSKSAKKVFPITDKIGAACGHRGRYAGPDQGSSGLDEHLPVREGEAGNCEEHGQAHRQPSLLP